MPLFLLRFLPLAMKAMPFLKGNWKTALPILGVVAMMIMLHFKNNSIDSLELDQARYTQWAEEMKGLNETNLANIVILEKANSELALSVIVSEEVRATAFREAQERARRAQVRLDDTRTQLRNLENETPTCAEISRIDIGAACPLSVELLRRAASGTFDRD